MELRTLSRIGDKKSTKMEQQWKTLRKFFKKKDEKGLERVGRPGRKGNMGGNPEKGKENVRRKLNVKRSRKELEDID